MSNMIKTSKYQDIRSELKDGDILLIRTGNIISGTLTKMWTKSEYCHCAIVFKMHSTANVERLMVVEQHLGGQRIVALSTYKDFDVIRLPLDFEANGQYLIENTGQVPYAYGDFIGIAIYEKFKVKLPDFKGLVCSSMVADYINKAGGKIPVQISPQGLYKEYKDYLIYRVRP